MRIIKYILVAVFILLCFILSAQPEGYYDKAEGLTGEELREALHEIIKDHFEYSYADLRDFILKDTDEDPDNSNNVILIYSGISRDKADFGGNVGEWNREHTWAKSHGDFGNIPAEGTDAHHIRPADVQINSTRGNFDFDIGGSPVSNCPGCKVDSDSFEPRNAVKGDVARMIFYMATRYMGNGELLLNVIDEVNTAPQPDHGKLSTLLDWHAQDPPDDFEMNRNEVVYDYQENRNPFIDHPEYVEEIWGEPTGIDDKNEMFVSVFPNPVQKVLNINTNINTINTYSIIGMDGRLIETGLIRNNNKTISFSEKLPGLYLLFLQSENGNLVKQVKILKTVR